VLEPVVFHLQWRSGRARNIKLSRADDTRHLQALFHLGAPLGYAVRNKLISRELIMQRDISASLLSINVFLIGIVGIQGLSYNKYDESLMPGGSNDVAIRRFFQRALFLVGNERQ
jgi:hypothetical protein